jgi:hypothetical protein
MREFFRGWRRRAAIVMLGLACILTVGWLRSFSRIEYIEAPIGISAIGVASMHGGLDFYRITSLENKPLLASVECKSFAFHPDQIQPPNTTPWGSEIVFDWRWDCAGFHLGAGHYSHRRDQDCMIPYWAVVGPLTVLSAYILLSKPKPNPRPAILASDGPSIEQPPAA